MSIKKTPADRRDKVIPILIEEFCIENEALLSPSAKIVDLQDDEDAIFFIVVRLEDSLDIEIPDGAEEKLLTIQDIYDVVAKASK